MDFELTETQHDILQGASILLSRMAGPQRARDLQRTGAYDDALEAALTTSGYMTLAAEEEAGSLEAALLVEQVAAALGTVAVGARALVLPALGVTAEPGSVALAVDRPDPVRFGGSGTTTALVADRGEAWLCNVTAEPLATSLGYPLGRLRVEDRQSLGIGSGDVLIRWWGLSVASELIGNMGAALALVVQYVKDRVQFGRPLGSFQAIQHRLARAFVRLEGSRLLTYSAAWSGAPSHQVASATTHAAAAGRMMVRELHQLCGAIGLTTEFDLHLWTMRLRALYLEVGTWELAARTSGRQAVS